MWAKIKNCDNYYINKSGDIKREKQIYVIRGKGGRLKCSYMKGYIGKNGYRVVMIPFHDGRKLAYVHRILAETFISNPDNKRTVNHKNGIKTDNRIENLEWATDKENTNHSIKTLGKHFVNRKKIKCVNTGDIYKSAMEASKVLNLNHGHICSCARGEMKTIGGFTFNYV